MIPFLLADVAPATVQLPVQASAQAAPVDDLYYWIYWLCVFFFVLILVVMALFAGLYRRQPGVQADQSHTHNLPLEMAWTIPPTIIVVFLFWWGFEGFMELRTPPADAYKIEVFAEKWKWTFRYPNGAEVVTNAPEVEEILNKDRAENGRAGKGMLPIEAGLHVWKDQPFVLVMTSNDVLHSFYVPDFRVKQDLVPGRYTKLWFTPRMGPEAGATSAHRIFCTEYCGKDHSQMWSQVVVHRTKEAFEVWLRQAKTSPWDKARLQISPDAPEQVDVNDPTYLAAVGAELFTKQCASCHYVEPGKPRNTGPNFYELSQAFGGKRAIEGGEVDLSTEEAFLAYVTQSIVEPNSQIAQGYLPGMTANLGDALEAEAPAEGLGYKAMAAYIRSLAKE